MTFPHLLPAEGNGACRFAVEQACGLLAGKGNRERTIVCDLAFECGDIDGSCGELTIHAGLGLAEIGKTDSKRQQRSELARVIVAWRDAGFMDGAPETVTGMRVVVAVGGRAC